MQTLTVNTDLHCKGGVEKIASNFNQDPTISDWSIDLNGEWKTLLALLRLFPTITTN
jgi:hypothetical protein